MASPLHSLSGSVPAGTLVQLPSLLLTAQDWQVAAQAALQQKSSMHRALSHTSAEVQGAPFSALPSWQVYWAEQD
jgi:hypothetical protein